MMRVGAHKQPPQQPPEYAYHVLRGAVERYGKGVAELTDHELAVVWRQADRTFALESRVLASSEAQGVLIPDEQVRAAIQSLASRYPDYAAFLQDLNTNGVSEDALYTALQRELIFDATLNKVASGSPAVSDVDVQLYYQMHLDSFNTPEMRHVRHLLVTINDEYAENARDLAKTTIERLRIQMMRDPELFQGLVQRYSECPTAMQGGLLGKVVKGTLYPELDAVLFRMREGEISKVVESEMGFHILRCERIEEARQLALEDVTEKVRAVLEERQRHISQKAWLTKIKGE